MRLRRWLLPALLLLVVAVVALLPATELGREFLLQQVTSTLESSGYRLEYSGSSGNAWAGVELEDARVQGPGADVSVDQLALEYFIPSLLAGELPLSLGLQGVRGELAPEEIAIPGGAGGSSPIRLQLRELDVADVSLNIADVPWTLPDLALEDVAISRSGEAVGFEATLATAQGEARVAGTAQLEPWLVDVEILRADATLARHWWGHISAGNVQGRLVADAASGVTADLALSDGAIDFIGLNATDISGPVTVDGGLISGDLTARGLDGPLAASVVVNVPASNWNAQLSGEPQLSRAAQWLAPESVDIERFDIDGTGNVEVSAHGWNWVELTGLARGEGSVLDRPLENLSGSFGFSSESGTSTDVTATLAGGGLAVRVQPAAEGTEFSVDLEGAQLLEGVRASATFDGLAGDAPLSGAGEATLAGSVLGRQVSLFADASLGGDGVQLFVNANDHLGASAQGAAVLTDGTLQGGLTVSRLALPGIGQTVDLRVQADGPLEELPISLAVSGPAATNPVAFGFELEQELTGNVTGTLQDGSVSDMEGQLGPLRLSGRLDLSPFAARIEYEVDELAASGPARLVASGGSGQLSYAEGALDTSGTLRLEEARSLDLALGPLNVDFDGQWNGSGSMAFEAHDARATATSAGPTEADSDSRTGAPSLSGSWEDGQLLVNLANPPLEFSEQPVNAQGRAVLDQEGDLRADATVSADGLELAVTPAEDGHRIELAAAAGSRLGPFTLAQPIEASGSLTGDLGSGRLTGELGDTEWQARLSPGDAGVRLEATVGTGGEPFELAFVPSTGNWFASGSLELDSLASAVDLPVSGLVEGSLTRGAQGYAGTMEITGEAEDAPFNLEIQGAGESLNLAGEATPSQIPLSLSGTLLPELRIEAATDFGALTLADGDLSGRGTLPSELGPLELAPTEWTLEGRFADARVDVVAGDSSAIVDWSDGLEVTGQVDQEFTFRSSDLAGNRFSGLREQVGEQLGEQLGEDVGEELGEQLDEPAEGEDASASVQAPDVSARAIPGRLQAEVEWSADEGATLAGILQVDGQDLQLSSDEGELRVEGDLEVAALARSLLDVELAEGILSLDARASLPQLEEAEASWTLRSDGEVITGTVNRTAGGWQATASGQGVEASFGSDQLVIDTQDAQLEPLLAFLPLPVRGPVSSDGSLSYDAAEGWDGQLRLVMDQPETNVELTGAGDSLTLDATLDSAFGSKTLQARAQGTLLPTLQLDVTATALSDWAQLTGTVGGEPTSPTFSGALTTAEIQQGPLRMDPVRLDLAGDLTEGLRVTAAKPVAEAEGEAAAGAGGAAGTATSLRLTPDSLAGALSLTVELFHRPHAVAANLSGSPSEPAVQLSVEGPMATGNATWEAGDGSGTFTVSPGALLPPPLVPEGPATLSLESSGTDWSAQGSIPVSLRGRTLDVTAALAGRGAAYSGDLGASTGLGRLLGASVTGEGGDLVVTAQLDAAEPAALDEFLPFATRLQPSGTVQLTNAPFGIAVDAAIQGEAAGEEVELRVSGDPLEDLQVDGSIAGLAVEASKGEQSLRFTLSGAGGASVGDVAAGEAVGDMVQAEVVQADGLQADLSGELSWAEALDLQLSGTLLGRNLTGAARYSMPAREGDLSFMLGEATLEGTARPSSDPSGVRVSASFDDQGSDPLAVPLNAQLELEANDGRVLVERVDVEAVVNGPEEQLADANTIRAALSGPLWPQPELAGTVTGMVPGLDRTLDARARLSGELPGAPVLTLSAYGLDLELSSGDQGVQAALTGEGQPPGLNHLASELSWSAEEGFSGQAMFHLPIGLLPRPDLQLAANLVGDGGLDAQLALAAVAGSESEGSTRRLGEGTVELSARPWEDPALAGRFEMSSPLSTFWPGNPGEAIGLSATANVGGTLTDPSVAGTVASSGAVETAGDFSYRGGQAELSLSGPQLDLDANLEGSVLEAAARLDLSLSHLPVGVELSGGIAGSVELAPTELSNLASATLRGSLQLDDAGLAADGSRLSGLVELTGPASAPRLHLDLEASGDAAGSLLADISPASRSFTLDSDLSWGPVALHGQASAAGRGRESTLQASGELTLPGGSFRISTGEHTAASGETIDPRVSPAQQAAPNEALLLQGTGSYQGWEVALHPVTMAVSAHGDLGSIGEEVSGRFSLWAGGATADQNWLEVHIDYPSWSDISLGSIRLASATPGAPLVIEGPSLQGSVDPTDGFDWELERLSLALPAGVDLSGSGSGRGDQGRLQLSVAGQALGEPLEGSLQVERSEETRLRATGDGRALEGRFWLDAELEGDSWDGELSLAGARLYGSVASASGILFGEFADPTLDLDVLVEGESLEAEGTARVSPTVQNLRLDLASPLLGEPLALEASLAGESWIEISNASDQRLLLTYEQGAPVANGELDLSVGTAHVNLRAGEQLPAELQTANSPVEQNGKPPVAQGSEMDAGAVEDRDVASGPGLSLTMRLPAAPGLGLTTAIPAARLAEPGSLVRQPIVFLGTGATEGSVALTLAPAAAEIRDLAYTTGLLRLEASGSLAAIPDATPEIAQSGADTPGAAEPETTQAEATRAGDEQSAAEQTDGAGNGLVGTLRGQVTTLERVGNDLTSAVPAGSEMPFEAHFDGGDIRLSSSGDLGTVEVDYSVGGGTAIANIDLAFEAGSVAGDLTYRQGVGPTGSLSLNGVPVELLAGVQPLRLDSEVEITPRAISGSAQIAGEDGTLRANGTLGLGQLLPVAFAPSGSNERQLDLRLGTFELNRLPGVASRVPYLSAPASGFVQLREQTLTGSLVAPDLAITGEPLPLSVELSGSLEALQVNGTVGGSSVRATVDGNGISSVATLDAFPMNLLAEAITGPTDVDAKLTGVTRLEWPWGGWEDLVVEVATEQVRLERSGSVTTGNLSMTIENRTLTVSEADFSGAGAWSMQGTVGPDNLDFRMEAEEADFTPMLGLVPQLARYDVEAQGSVEIELSGTPADPSATAFFDGLDFSIAGSDFRLTEGEAALSGDQLTLLASVDGIEPLTGSLEVAGEARLVLQPASIEDARFTVEGEANVPWLGDVREFQAEVSSRPETPLWLAGSGRIGQPFTIEGSLAPLDLSFSGSDLALRLPQLLLESAQVDTDMRLRWEEAALILSGAISLDEGLFRLGIRPPSTGDDDEPNPFASRFLFEDLTVTAPGRVRFNENFGSAELSLDLTVGGSAAQPALNGTAEVIRGSLQFSGRDFTIRSATATFDPTGGIFPSLQVDAVTSFEMSRISAGGDIEFVAPTQGNRFQVELSFDGEVEERPGESPPFRLDLTPTLSSNAVIRVARENTIDSGPRELTEGELLSLITLGRLELNAPLAGDDGLAAAVAEGAIDTAVDLIFVSELQNALAEALGVELVEIQTTALSSVLSGGGEDPFTVSVRLGGYISEDVFASYRFGTFDEVRGLYALTNEVNLSYELGPLELDLGGRVSFSDANVSTPSTELNANVRYDIYGPTGIEAGVGLSNDSQEVRFGVSIRW